ncbi:MAG: VWA domain-containing protein [Bryobacteraceae bacterium]
MKPLKLIAATATALLAATAQEPQTAPTIKVEVDVVNILCSVRDKRGALVPGLSREDFVVKEDGKQQEIRYFSRETDLPLTLGLLVDVSRSQEKLIGIERNTASQFFKEVLRKRDMAFLISFGSEAELLQDYTNSISLLRDGLDQLRPRGAVGGVMDGPVPTIYQTRGTVLYDAVYLASNDKLKGEVGRKAIVLITDGVDMGSRVKLEAAIEAAQKADAIIYSIYYYDPSAYNTGGSLTFGGGNDSILRRMSEETGGRLFKVSKKNTLEDIFKEIQEEMRSQYAIGYTPSSSVKDGAYRRLEVTSTQKDLKVQARKGYYSATPGS